MTNLTRSLCQLIADELGEAMEADIPVFVQRREPKVQTPFVVVALDEFEPLQTGDRAGKAKINVVLATDAYKDAEIHETASGEIDAILTALQKRPRLFGHDICLLGMTVVRTAQTKTGDDARTMTRGDIWEIMAAASVAVYQPDDSLPPWPDDGEEPTKFLATSTLSGGRFVYLAEGYASYADAPTSAPAMGYIKHAVVQGATVDVYRQGTLTGLVGLIPETDYYLGESGQFTPDPEVSGIIQYIGRALSDTELLVEIDSPILVE
jgi:hypothetical protein